MVAVGSGEVGEAIGVFVDVDGGAVGNGRVGDKAVRGRSADALLQALASKGISRQNPRRRVSLTTLLL